MMKFSRSSGALALLLGAVFVAFCFSTHPAGKIVEPQESKSPTASLPSSQMATPPSLPEVHGRAVQLANSPGKPRLSLEEQQELHMLRSLVLDEFKKVEHRYGRLLFESSNASSLEVFMLFEEPGQAEYEEFSAAGRKVLKLIKADSPLYENLLADIATHLLEFTSYPARYKVVEAFIESDTGAGIIMEGFCSVEPKVSEAGKVTAIYNNGLLISKGLDKSTWGKKRYGYLFSGH